MITLKERNPWAEIAEQFGQGLNQGYAKEQDYQHKLGLQKAKEKQDNLEAKKRGIESIEDMRAILKRGKTGWNFFNYLTPEGRGDRSAMDAAALNLERLAVEMQGKGTLSKPRFEYMVKRLPSSGKSDAENEKILEEWERILGVRKGEAEEAEEGETEEREAGPSKEKFVFMLDREGRRKKVSSKEVNEAKKHGYKTVK